MNHLALLMFFELYRDTAPRTAESWRWRLLEANGSVLAIGASGYGNESACRNAVSAVMSTTAATPVIERVSLHCDYLHHRKDRRAYERSIADAKGLGCEARPSNAPSRAKV